MCSPAPYSRPKRRIVSRKQVVLRTAKGSYIYAPAPGSVHTDHGVVTITHGRFKHVLKGVRYKRKGNPRFHGARIGVATGRKVIYSVYEDGKQIDAMPFAIRNDSKRKPRLVMKGARKVKPQSEAGVMGPGDEHCAVWHTSESNPGTTGPVLDWVQSQGSQYTIIWDPYEKNPKKRFTQIFQADDGARALKNADNDSYGTNRHGKIRIQICVIGRAGNAPLVKSPMYGRRDLMEWLDDWGIPRVLNLDLGRSKHNWEKSGHTTHRSCPGNDHGDPGAINKKRLLGP